MSYLNRRSKFRNKYTRPRGAKSDVREYPLMAGTFCAAGKSGANGYLVALDSKVRQTFPVAPKAAKKLGLADGHRVMFKINSDGQLNITEIFGHKDDPGMDVFGIIRQYGVPYIFSEQAQSEADALPLSVSEEECRGRTDLRDWDIITIDGSDTKDIDDAISLEILPNGHFKLGVHIADVSYYVRPGSALDKNARARGTSIYLADRVIPMLPQKLSNGICSLNPGVDRLTLSCIMEVGPAGDVINHEIFPSVIRSRKQYTYDEVAASGDVFWKPYFSLAEILRKKRHLRGALEFNFSEAKVAVDDRGHPVSIEARRSNIATSLIEEFMIVCNETVAEQYEDDPFVFRTHEEPDLDKMFQLSAYAHNLGHHLPVSEHKKSGAAGRSGAVSSKALQTLVEKMEPALEPAILRSLKQARYTAENIGHFGLASECYCHFTSPIRRYPDLLVHRGVKGGLKRRGLVELCGHCSQTERNAEALERDVLQLKKVQFMADKIGEVFEGFVSGVVSWGIYIQLPNTVEGLVPIDFLIDDRYYFVEKQMALFGAQKKKRIRMGDPFTVVLTKVNEEERWINFAPHRPH